MTDQPPDDFAERALHRRKREDTALAIPLLGVVLLCSPLLNVVAGPLTVFGLPAGFAYIFAAWLGLIIVTRALARRLDSSPRDPR